MKAVGIIPNWHKNNSALVVDKVESFFSEHKVDLLIAEDKKVDFYSDCSLSEQLNSWYDKLRLIIVVGGDGTILRVARDLAFWNIPVLGINLGQKGFLAEIEVEQMERFLHYIVSEQYDYQERMMLEAILMRNGKELGKYMALNDIVVARGPFSRIVKVDVYINKDYMESYSGDGVIIATPTGSTGYSLSAGGPIINPTMKLSVITPICPHSLYNRSVIVDKTDKVKLKVDSSQVQVALTVDGQVRFSLEDKDQVFIQCAEQTVRLVCFHDHSFYHLLHQKLKA